MYIGASSNNYTKKFSFYRIPNTNPKTKSLMSYSIDGTINWKVCDNFNMIKIVNFNIGIRLKNNLLKKFYC